jgi:hypothetical protein
LGLFNPKVAWKDSKKLQPSSDLVEPCAAAGPKIEMSAKTGETAITFWRYLPTRLREKVRFRKQIEIYFCLMPGGVKEQKVSRKGMAFKATLSRG